MSFLTRNAQRLNDLFMLSAPDPLTRFWWKKKDAIVLIFQPGKVASSTIQQSLKADPTIASFQFHRTHGENLDRFLSNPFDFRNINYEIAQHELLGHLVKKHVSKSTQPIKIVSLVREPIGRNLSAYFQNWELFRDQELGHHGNGHERTLEGFIRNYPHGIPLHWFDDVFQSFTGINIFDHPFDRDNGYTRIDDEHFQLLIMHHDIPDQRKVELLSTFLDRKLSHLKISNKAEEKNYAEIYSKLKKVDNLSEEYVLKMLNTKYCRHFYNRKKRIQIARQWNKGLDAESLLD